MDNWDDIIKETLQGYESPLPEGDLQQFHARRAAASAAKRRRRILWMTSAPLAAGLAAFLILGYRNDGVQESAPARDVVASADVRQETRGGAETPEVLPDLSSTEAKPDFSVPECMPSVESGAPEVSLPGGDVSEDAAPAPDDGTADAARRFTADSRPSEDADDRTARYVLPADDEDVIFDGWPIEDSFAVPAPARGDLLALSTIETHISAIPLGLPGGGEKASPLSVASAGMFADAPLNVARHYRPIVAGVSARFSVAGRLDVTTGLEYSMYTSQVSYALSPGTLEMLGLPHTMTQYAHYLGVPVRLDWTFDARGWLTAYAGAGFKGDCRVAASRGGVGIGGSALVFSLLAAAGVQAALSPRVGLYAEPQLSWTPASQEGAIETFRSRHPFMMTISAGLRFNLGNI